MRMFSRGILASRGRRSEDEDEGEVGAQKHHAGDDEVQGDRGIDPAAIRGKRRQGGGGDRVPRPGDEHEGQESEDGGEPAPVPWRFKHEPPESIARGTGMLRVDHERMRQLP